MELVIDTRSVTKNYSDVKAVDRLSLRVQRGEIYAFLGLNGAGKTTTIRMLLGMVRPTEGEILIFGEPLQDQGNRCWSRVGYLVETPHPYPELTVRENLEIMRKLHPGLERKAVDSILDRLRLAAIAERKAAHLSLGNHQRLGLAKALMHQPELLILDEPANGLDPAGIVEIRTLLKELATVQQTTVLVSSHQLAEVSLFADRIGIIHEGRLIKELDSEGLNRERLRWLELQTDDNEAALLALKSQGFEFTQEANGTLRSTEPKAIESPGAIATLLVEAKLPPTGLKVEEENLEHYFLRLIESSSAAAN